MEFIVEDFHPNSFQSIAVFMTLSHSSLSFILIFSKAEKEQLEAGDQSMLHIIILDEMDAICKSRGTVRDGTGVSDSVVNQLLAKIDGVDSLNNILLIGMTNRKDMIDDALLRPGRLEVHVEIGLPDTKGRLQILNIHTKNMRESNRITPEVLQRLGEVAEKTKNFSGAELEGLIKAATSYALTRCVDVKDLSKAPDEKNLILTYDDFQRALDDVEPKFGAKNTELKGLFRNGFVPYGENFDYLMNTMEQLVEQGKKIFDWITISKWKRPTYEYLFPKFYLFLFALLFDTQIFFFIVNT